MNNVPAKRSRQEYPKMVYHHESGNQKIINSEDERPDGYVSYDAYRDGSSEAATADAAAGAIIAAEAASSRAAAAEAEAAKEAALNTAKEAAEAEAAKAEKEAEEKAAAYRVEMKEFLDKHDVQYAPQLGTKKLEELVEQLTNHLEKKAADEAQAGASDGNAD